ncbi:MAG: hypothetical protein ABID87_09195 [Chloroflexota bacterium]
MVNKQAKWELLVPEAPVKALRTDVAPGIEKIAGKRVGLFWNLKPNGEVFLLRAGERLRERFPDISLQEFLPGKPDMTRGASPAALKEVAEKCDVVILSTGD